ncbi:MAG: spore cortex biosynthesis protein YabQ [Firmicutes bacterium]|nr:spore cortex biosynthesis protein YabQ [Bacillota bacterium]
MVTEPLAGQFALFFYTILTGMLAGFIYDFYVGLGHLLRLRKISRQAGDILFWLVLTAVVYAMLWYYNRGEVRFFVLLGLGVGAVVYYWLCRRAARKVIFFGLTGLFSLLRLVGRVGAFFLAGIFMPVRMLFVLLVWPFRLIGGGLGKTGGLAARVGRKITPGPVKAFYRCQRARWREIKTLLKRKQ